jgi:PDZ domain-containing protein
VNDQLGLARARTLTIGGVTTAALTLAAVFLPVPYVVEMPGPTLDVLGSADGVELIGVPEAPDHPVTGQLRLTTVRTRGSDRDLTVGEAAVSWISAADQVIPYDAAYPKASTKQEREERSAQQMVSSQELASVAALGALGLGVELRIVDALPGPAAEVLKPDDVLVSIDGTMVRDFEHLLRVLSAIPAGSTITVAIRRSGQSEEVTLRTLDDGAGGSRMGVTVGFALPVDVEFGIEGIGGSSAGAMFALGIVDKLGEVDLAAGRIVAGTGTVDPYGNIGPIGGIQQKMVGARRDGAEFFLAPRDNCPQVLGSIPPGLTVAAVATLNDALDALSAMRSGDLSDLATCDSLPNS